jgi:hypothetical protein
MAEQVKYRDCLIYIDKEVIEEDQAKGKESMLDSKPLVTVMPTSNRVKNLANKGWGNDENIYIRIKETNMILMHIRGNYCIIVSEYINLCKGGKKSIIEHISSSYFSINEKCDVVTAGGNNKSKKLYRQIMALQKNGTTTDKLSAEDEIHHKFARWLNTQEAMKIVDKITHIDIENGQKSHRYGRVIKSAEDLKNFLSSTTVINQHLEGMDNLII